MLSLFCPLCHCFANKKSYKRVVKSVYFQRSVHQHPYIYARYEGIDAILYSMKKETDNEILGP